MRFKTKRKISKSVKAFAQALETRRLFSTMTAAGIAYVDSNANGVQDSGETGLAGVTIFQDLVGSGVYAQGDPITSTGSNGSYSLTITDPTDGFSPEIVVEPLTGYHLETTGTGFAFLPGTTLAFNVAAATQSYVTANVQLSEDGAFEGFSGATVYADLNNDGVLDAGDISAATDYTGGVQFGGLPQGSLTMTLVVPAGYSLDGTAGSQSISVGTLTASTVYFRIQQNTATTGSISGTVFNDYNGDGVQEEGEPAFGNTSTVYLDLNDSGVFNPNDPTFTTYSTGQFDFTGLQPGNYAIRQVLPSGYYSSPSVIDVTVTAGQNTSVQIGAAQYSTVTGEVFNDLSGDGAVSANPGLGGVEVYLDVNGTGTQSQNDPTTFTNYNGEFTLNDCPVGTFYLREVIPTGDIATRPSSDSQFGGGVTQITLTTGTSSPFQYFGDFIEGTVSGTVFNDANGNGVQDTGEAGLDGWTVFVDENGTETLASNDPHATTNSSGYFTINGVGPISGSFVYAVSPSGFLALNNMSQSILESGSTLALNFPAENLTGPTARTSGPYNVSEGSSVTLSGATSFETSGQILKYEWDLNYNGSVFDSSATGATVPFSAAALIGPSIYTVALRVTDAEGNTNITTTQVNITAVAPTAVLSGSTVTIGAAGVVSFTSPYNPSPAEVAAGFTYSYDFADNGTFEITGTTSATAVVPATYLATAGAHTIHGRIQDAGGDFSDYITTVQVNAASVTPLTGTVIGTSGSYKSDGNTIAKAFDGNLTTFFDGPNASGNWAGLDLGSAKIITSLAYVSRSGWASRMNGGMFQGSNSSAFTSGVVNLYTIASNANPSATAFTTQTVTNTNAYRYVRYYSPANSYGDVAEIELFGRAPIVTVDSVNGIVTSAPSGTTVYLDANNNSKFDSGEFSTTTGSNGAYSFSNVPAGSYVIRQVLPSGYTQMTPEGNAGYSINIGSGSSFTSENFTDKAPVTYTRLTGTTIGTAGSYQNDGYTIAKATDGSLSTMFVGPTANGNWVGYDLGSSRSISQIKFAPASNWASRLVGGQIQISTTANFSSGVTTVYTITATPPVGSLTTVTLSSPVTARYIRYLSPNGSYGEIAEFQVFG